jgi:hypothetical protein
MTSYQKLKAVNQDLIAKINILCSDDKSLWQKQQEIKFEYSTYRRMEQAILFGSHNLVIPEMKIKITI